ncbi:hypothetical protein EVAR_100433_1 [Eumeta japonica]|uniref:Mariner Mos1 transposase n=1 Tax=Eumeta variegata TaxID=151549 RepID=A0A4C2A626_EUMVA|nr:hypothetical protein EVAR_100433_1 [Eumeta japonica]
MEKLKVFLLLKVETLFPLEHKGRFDVLFICRHYFFGIRKPLSPKFYRKEINKNNMLRDQDCKMEFKRCRANLSNEFCDGRPSTAVNNKNIDAVRRMIETDKHVTHHEIRTSLGIGMSQI